MKPLIVLLTVFSLSFLINKVFRGSYQFAFSGRIAIALMLLFTAIGHFAYTKGMTMMLPAFVPFKKEVVLLTGIIEIVAAIGLFIPSYRIITGWLLVFFFLLILPANIYASSRHIDYQKGTFDGYGLAYLWFRIPLQAFFIIWIYLTTIKNYRV